MVAKNLQWNQSNGRSLENKPKSNNKHKFEESGYQNCNANQISIFGGYVKVRESLYTRVII